jgi:hypothetical protein
MQELWANEGFHQDFKGKSERPDNAWQGQNPCKAACKRAMCESERLRTKLQWRAQKVRNDRNVECPPRKASNKWSQSRQKGHMGYKWQSCEGKAAQALGRSHDTTMWT